MIQAPGFQGTTQQTPRVLTRGTFQVFLFKFFYDQNETVPVQPMDGSQYPNFTILSPRGEILSQGIAMPYGSPGTWRVGWFVPKSAMLTDVYRRYRFQTVMVDKDGRQFETSFEFDMVESQVAPQHPMPQQLVAFVGDPLRIFFHNTTRPDLLRVKVVPRGQDNQILHSALFNPTELTPGPNSIIEVPFDTGLAYYTDVPKFPAAGDYSVIWTVRDTELSPQDSEHVAVQIVNTSIMHMVKSLRLMVDKLQKKKGLVFAYQDSDLIDYLNNGTALVNGFWPPTNFTLTNMPGALQAYQVLAAAIWALNSQKALYAETNLNFGGQTVNLDYNPGPDLDSVISNYQNILDNNLKATKKNIVRSASNVGTVATRAQGWGRNLVFKVNGVAGGDIFNTLAALGLFD